MMSRNLEVNGAWKGVSQRYAVAMKSSSGILPTIWRGHGSALVHKHPRSEIITPCRPGRGVGTHARIPCHPRVS